MSDIWLVLAVASAFFSIVLVGIAIESAAPEERALRLLEAQVGSSESSVNLRDQELSKNSASGCSCRSSAPGTAIARRITPLDTRDRLAKKLLLAGSPAGGTPSACSPSR